MLSPSEAVKALLHVHVSFDMAYNVKSKDAETFIIQLMLGMTLSWLLDDQATATLGETIMCGATLLQSMWSTR